MQQDRRPSVKTNIKRRFLLNLTKELYTLDLRYVKVIGMWHKPPKGWQRGIKTEDWLLLRYLGSYFIVGANAVPVDEHGTLVVYGMTFNRPVTVSTAKSIYSDRIFKENEKK